MDDDDKIVWWREYWDALDIAGQIGGSGEQMKAIMETASAANGDKRYAIRCDCRGIGCVRAYGCTTGREGRRFRPGPGNGRSFWRKSCRIWMRGLGSRQHSGAGWG